MRPLPKFIGQKNVFEIIWIFKKIFRSFPHLHPGCKEVKQVLSRFFPGTENWRRAAVPMERNAATQNIPTVDLSRAKTWLSIFLFSITCVDPNVCIL